VRKRKLKKVVESVAPEIEPAAKVIEIAALTVKVVNVARFLAAWRKQAPPPSMSHMADVKAFLANELVMAVLVNVLEPTIEEPLRAPEGPFPSMINHPLGSNI
jgi:hypothetical protein